ncbi:hypothetical protein PC41400_04350 [Paenibacillus chitinolyticus]|uniref:HPP family protein n=1 Tax=Paenibacillus chitinolyticus TaxID=79263 RepID=A0A410WRN4_9BACL|nr:hypothetical protein [Paenibacillus chitinolyticus]MCY9592131.1 hypothetical protein [Paenibacillus chitinolyticus]MCY9598481.1 hypothetical protein [Paenibacillus chitinolyticus]QAV16957.1 hypothetical protein PC41400_04350 [Paenibacillus chitinolyticus]
MNVKIIGVALYIMLIYGISKHYPAMHGLFFPALGAFSFLFISRPFNAKAMSSISAGAVLATVVGTLIYYLVPGILALFVNTLIIIWLNKVKWNAPPILAVSLIPFFTETPRIWDVPLAVALSLAGLTVTLLAADFVHKLLMVTFRSGSKLAPGSEEAAG